MLRVCLIAGFAGLLWGGEALRGKAEPGAMLRVLDGNGRVLGTVQCDVEGNYEVSIVGAARVEPAPVASSLTVTAKLGTPEEAAESPHVSLVREERALRARPLPVLGQALQDLPGVLVQQTSAAQVSPFLRGLTGYHVLNLIDGVRFNNSTFRSGPNQYLAFVEPSQAARVEAVLGPAGALYGSDALGGTLQVLTPQTRSGWSGDGQFFSGSADRSTGGSARLGWGGEKWQGLLGGSLRRHNDLRAGAATDSRHALRRLFGLEAQTIRGITGPYQRNTAFSQTGAFGKLLWRPREDVVASGWYQYSEQTGVNSTKDLWGGLGRMESKFEPQRLHFGYGRLEKRKVGPLDSVSANVSFNSQADGTVRHGLRLANTRTVEQSRVDALGFRGQGVWWWSARGGVTFGGDLYREQIRAERFDDGRPVRPLYPDGSRYRTGGWYAQASESLLGDRLRAAIGLRGTRVAYRSSAAQQSFEDVTFNGSLSGRVVKHLLWHAAGGRGFRAPNLNDLGALGLNDLGYEIPAAEAAGALVGDSAGEGALPSGRAVRALRAESLWNAEVGMSWVARRVTGRVQFFHSDLADPIVRRTLLFTAGQIPAALAGLPVIPIAPTPAQLAAGVRTVAAAADPRALKAFVNDGQSRYYGVESRGHVELRRDWIAEASYSFIAGRDLYPNRHIRRLPPQNGFLALRYLPRTRRVWAELSVQSQGAQRRLSGGDRDDERIGASRSRRDIADFFSGSRIAPYLSTDGRFLPTGETLLQIQNRVLPGVADTLRVPLYGATAGWVVVNVRGGVPLAARLDLNYALENLLDRNYRHHGSGIDAAGFNAWVSLRWRFGGGGD